MNWWLSDILAGRTAGQLIQYQSQDNRVPQSRASQQALARLAMSIHALAASYRQRMQTKRTQRVLLRLSDHQLDDIGLSRDEVRLATGGFVPRRDNGNPGVSRNPAKINLVECGQGGRVKPGRKKESHEQEWPEAA